MEIDYQYEQLSPRAFEQLAVALCNRSLGMGLEVYGPGPDGGREASYRGTIPWSAGGDDVWEGYTVVQAKLCEDLLPTPEKYLTWLKGQIGPELAKWMNPESKRSAFPDYLLLITNAKLSGHDPGGTMRKFDQYLEECLERNYGTDAAPTSLRSRGLREIRVWHRYKLSSLVTGDSSVRQRFLPLLSLGDVVSRIPVLPGLIPPDKLAPVFIEHAQSTLLTERWIRFHDAGDVSRRSVETVIFDLPFEEHGVRGSIIAKCLEQGDRLLRRSTVHAETVGDQPPPRHLVVTGAPGNGKTTLTRYLTQLYRSSFLRDDVTDATEALSAAVIASSVQLTLAPPKVRRWALRVDLAAMAMEMGPDDAGPSIRGYLCEQISRSAVVPIQIGSLDDWFKRWPAVVILDGLDEVTHPLLRDRVTAEIEALVSKLDDLDADVMLIVTTRPMGYSQTLPAQHFRQIDLASFTVEEAVDYGRHMIDQRLADDEEDYRLAAKNKFESALQGAGADRLLQTPLQVLILTIIATNSGSLPANRYQLFWIYYDTVFKREAAKRTTHQNFFRDFGGEIAVIHQRVGLLLQQRCEATRELRGRLALEELWTISRDRLAEIGHSLDAASALADTMVSIAMHRLVLLSADEAGDVSFDIRSLQELMAGRAMVSGSDEESTHNLRAAAISPHWRNAWLFAAGYMFEARDRERELLLDVVETCDETERWPSWLYPAGPGLAANLLDDGMAGRRPSALRRLITVALRCLSGPMPEDPKAIAMGLNAVSTEPHHRAFIRSELQAAFATDPMRRGIAAALVAHGSYGPHIPGQPDDVTRFSDMWRFRPSEGESVKVGWLMRTKWVQMSGTAHPPAVLSDVFTDADVLTLKRTAEGDLWPQTSGKMFNAANIHAVLQDPILVQDLRLVLDDLDPLDWAARSLLARTYWSAVSRWLVAAELRSAIAVTSEQPSLSFPR